MKHALLKKVGIFLLLAAPFYGFAQVACGYTFSYSNTISYAPIPEGEGTLILASGADQPAISDDISPTDEDFFPQQEIGFPFQFNGNTYTQLGVATNGWIWFGNNNPVRAAGLVFPFTQVLNSEFPIDGIVSALNADLEGRWTAGQAQIRLRRIGTAPFRTITIEWSNFKSLDDAEGTGYCGENRNRFDFQIILEEDQSKIHFAYNTAPYCWQGYEQFFQIGLRGSTPADVHSRSVNPGAQAWANSTQGFSHSTAVIRSGSPVTLPAQNARYTFAPGTAQALTWLGVNSNWFDPQNWSGQQVPGRCNPVLIPGGLNYYPELNGNQAAACENMSLQDGAALSLNANYGGHLSIFGNLVNQGVITNNASSYITLAGGPNRSLGGEGFFIGTDLFITAQSEYRLINDLVLRNLEINEGSSLKLENNILDVWGIRQRGQLHQGTGVLVIEGSESAVQLTDSTFIAGQGTTFFGNGEVWAQKANQRVPSLHYHNLWVRTNKDYKVWLGSNADFSCNNLMFYNPGEAGGVAETARNISLSGSLSLGIDSFPGTELVLNHRITRTQDGGQFIMKGRDKLLIQYSSGSQSVLAGFQQPDFSGDVLYNSAMQQKVMKGSYQNLSIQGGGTRQAQGRINLKGVLRLEGGLFQTADSLVLKSDSLGTALISGAGQGSLSGEVEIERYIYGNGNQFILYSSALQEQSWTEMQSDFTLNGDENAGWSNSGIWEFSEVESAGGFGAGWQSREQAQIQMIQSRAYLASAAGNSVISARGLVNSGNRNLALSSTNANAGWNLAGNPYPSPIDWNKVIADQSAAVSASMATAGKGNRYNGQFSVWLPLGENDGLGINGASRYVGSQEGFFVRSFSNDTLKLRNHHRVEITDPRVVQVPEFIPFVKLSLVSGSKADETLIYFSQQANSAQAQDGTDAAKVPALPGNNWFCSLKENLPLAIQGRSRLNGKDTIPLTVHMAQAGTVQIRFSEAHHFPATAMIYLEDRNAGTMQNLRQQPSYGVQLPAGDVAGRFYLHVHEGVQVQSFDEGCDGHSGRIALNNATNSMWNVEVFNAADSLVGTRSPLNGTWELSQLVRGEYRLHFSLSGSNLQVDEYVTVDEGNSINAMLEVSATEVKIEEDAVEFRCLSANAEQIFWNLGDGTLLSGESLVEHIYQEAGSYPVVLTVNRGTCSDTAMAHIQVITVTGIEEAGISQSANISVYPNPASTSAWIKTGISTPVKSASFIVVDLSGKVVFRSEEKPLNPGALLELPVNNLSPGQYEVVVFLDGQRKGSRLSVQR